MTKRKAKHALPNRGDVFLMPLEDGRFGVCRVLRRCTPEDLSFISRDDVLVAATPWVGVGKPDLSEPLLRETLVLNHHSWENQPQIIWVRDAPPPGFSLIGSLEPTSAEDRLQSYMFGAWQALAIQVLDQWRWDNDREAVLQADERHEQEGREQRESEARRRRECLDRVSLEELGRKERFRHWEGYVPDAALEATREVFRDTVVSIIGLGASPPEELVLEKLEACIEALNALDVELEGFILTMEREDICEEFEEIVHASGLGHYQDLADRWRDW